MVNNASAPSKRTDRFSPVTLWRAVEAARTPTSLLAFCRLRKNMQLSAAAMERGYTCNPIRLLSSVARRRASSSPSCGTRVWLSRYAEREWFMSRDSSETEVHGGCAHHAPKWNRKAGGQKWCASTEAPPAPRSISGFLRYTGWRQRGRAALSLQHPVLARFQELKANHPTNCLEVFLHPNHAHQGNEALWPRQLESRTTPDLPLRRETAATASHICGLNMIFKLVPKLIAP